MSLSPRFIAVILAFLISLLTTTFLAFVDGVSRGMLFVTAISSFVTSFFLVLYTVDILVFREVNKMYRTIQKLKMRDFNIAPRKKLIQESNPLRTINDEIFVYVTKKQKEIDELKKLELFRREFLADVSHEFKTPIFAAQGFIHTLLDGAMEDENVRERFLLKAAKNLDSLDILVKDLLVLSQMETGDIKMNFLPMDIRLLTSNVYGRLENIAADRNIALKIKPDNMPEVWVKADPDRMEQVMLNLIENAIKYGNENGKVIVHFNEGKKYIEVAIRDNGPGISPEHLNRIFERFYRVDKSRSKEIGGTGLGLAIVKHILNAHGTKIAVMSKPEKGTTFSFKLEKASVESTDADDQEIILAESNS
ncbi:sensor histidine kinase [Dyadobacter sediminis]|uniref:histidine kinase n=1 Tax=Dyadobacter sediminis TaxID=1493691 RepID=A0A5R9K7B9_9BACT|nr:ATP-binding protein [Dyadobacter sediminis]TLU89769.1 two-component sensor histidine kinase [Dyadobacter sediminis]GGC12954.1 two-component sensor histidine kinase [Dyadobacter sediminis]